ncbi:hypothetical protein SERLA73DRAFT_191297 [Serpula lacrymans var. lacrymans S7.3]|uniref:Uncharacterized protein n=1 Tax=Serpula lacrymans var. lacrymans (strain S7.3) TaxID=936435 RepID=F8QH90_SERL3|nr:hypothetical protein SERLA73DRAFT_191297 [Serpula lacrymans var. lacrymans S7.3]
MICLLPGFLSGIFTPDRKLSPMPIIARGTSNSLRFTRCALWSVVQIDSDVCIALRFFAHATPYHPGGLLRFPLDLPSRHAGDLQCPRSVI